MSYGGDSHAFSNISASTAAFTLLGGRYMAAAVATFGGGSVKLQCLGPDGSTYLSVNGTAGDFSAAGTSAVLYLPAGQYRFTIATATAVYCSVAAIPNAA
jgi:hypothetical protein